MNIDKIVKLIRYTAGLPKSIYVNLRLLPFSQAVLLPIIVSRKTKLRSLSGKVQLSKVKTGIVRIGFGGTDMMDYAYERTILKITGKIHFQGKTKIGVGAKIMVSGNLTLGDRFDITGDATIICAKEIEIGNNTMIAWQSILMDTDQHAIYNAQHTVINQDKKITIGNNVWIGARSLILKGSVIPDGCIVGANTTITKSFTTKKSIIAGNPAEILKENISWNH
ncbi:acyltransferase [Sulfurimonas sp. NW15]|uniref:acyltransferase n=1 Tax=Sulfurimonas sp. NW15 TaxID=2922729 RepID=UPI003DA7FE01